VQARGWPRGPEAGFTLIEVVIALAILGFALVALLQLSSQSLRLVKTSGDYQQAMLLADRLATTTQATDETADGGEEGPFRWERRISLVPLPEELQPKETIPGKEPPKLFVVTVGVRWGQNQLLELATLRTPTTAPVVPGSQPATITGTQQPTTSGTGQPTTSGTGQPTTFGARPGGLTSPGVFGRR
jgi:prepilin-type N-terminal cleavage/methylation domain-containing protein